MRRHLLSLSAAAIVCGFFATPACPLSNRSISSSAASLRAPLDARDCANLASSDCDVLVENSTFLSTFNRTNGIDISKFNGATVGGEWLVGLGRNFEGGLGHRASTRSPW